MTTMIFRLSPKRGCSLLALAALTVFASAQLADVRSLYPAYHDAPPKTPPPPLLRQDQWTGEFFTHHYQTTAYEMASAIPDVIYQLPCYCWCSKAMAHKSLHSCFENSHGAACSVCMKEAAFAYQQTKQGKRPRRSAPPSRAVPGTSSISAPCTWTNPRGTDARHPRRHEAKSYRLG